ncbi:MAG: efflux RND transporter permease subunit, partial [Bradymonadaceae bacterium]
LITGLFLGLEIAFWAATGMAVSFLGAVLFMPALGVSLNMISLFAFILTLGVVVDDAIVVGEAVYTARDAKDGKKGPIDAAIEGTREVAVPVTFAILTTVVTFAPLLFVPGAMGKFFIQMPLIVIPILLVSLVECLFILPAHLAHPTSLTDWGLIRGLHRLHQWFSRGVDRAVARVFRPLADLALRFRYATIATGIALCLATVGLIGGGVLKFTFMPRIEKDKVKAGVQMPISTPVGETRKATGRLVDEAKRMIADLESGKGGEKISEGILAEVGTSSVIDAKDGSHLTEVVVSLVPSDQRDITAREFAQRWRERVGQIPGAESVAFDFDLGPGSGASVSFDLHHENNSALRRAAERLAAKLKTFEGVDDVDDGFQRGKEQLDLTLKPEARALGVTEAMLARQIRGAFYGLEVDRIQRGREELRVYVRRPKSERDSKRDLEGLLIQTPEGGEIPLAEAANIQRERAPTTITRTEGGRVITVTADVAPDVTTGSEITSAIETEYIPKLKEQISGLGYEVSGNQQERQRSMKALGLGFLLALMVIYGLMAVHFQSYIQPVVVMAAIPFGFVGAAAGHLLMGYSLSLVSMMGVVALSGIVVNNSLVLISSINDHRDTGPSVFDAAVSGAVRRFRPIVLTSLTTFFGLGPMIFETSVQAKFLIPMALSLGFGVLFVTSVSLLVVPALYLVLMDVKGMFGEEERAQSDQSDV